MSHYQIRATWPHTGGSMVLGTGAGSEQDAIAAAALLVPSLMRGARIEVERIDPPGQRA